MVGMLTIALGRGRVARRPAAWVLRLSLVALGAGIVCKACWAGCACVLDERTLARLHGCVGPLFFAPTVALATITSRWWSSAAAAGRCPRRDGLQRLAVATAALAYLQLVLGSFLRHLPIDRSYLATFRLS